MLKPPDKLLDKIKWKAGRNLSLKLVLNNDPSEICWKINILNGAKRPALYYYIIKTRQLLPPGPAKVANTFGKFFAGISANNNYSTAFQTSNAKKEQTHLKTKSDNCEELNQPFNTNWLTALKKKTNQHCTRTGLNLSSNISNTLKTVNLKNHLPNNFNKICTEGVVSQVYG